MSDLIPSPFKMYLYLAAGLAILAGSGLLYYKINHAGYERCKNEYESAAMDAKNEADKNIQKVSKAYEDQKTKIYHQTGPNDLVGPRTKLAIDSLRDPQRGAK